MPWLAFLCELNCPPALPLVFEIFFPLDTAWEKVRADFLPGYSLDVGQLCWPWAGAMCGLAYGCTLVLHPELEEF